METSLRVISSTAAGLEPMLTIDELSEYLDVPVRTLYDWRLTGRGPRAVHVDRALRYLSFRVRWEHMFEGASNDDCP